MKRIFILFTAMVLVAASFGMAMAEDPFCAKRHTWSDRQTFRAPVKFQDPLLGTSIVVEGDTENAYETTLTFTEPTADNTVTVPNSSGYVSFHGGKTLSSSSGYTTGTGLSVSAADMTRYSTFFVNVTSIGASCATSIGPSDGTGVTVVLAVPTAVIHGKPVTFINTTGTTDFFLYVTGGLPIDTTTGTTDVLTADAEGDAITVVPSYNTAVSYYIQSYRIH